MYRNTLDRRVRIQGVWLSCKFKFVFGSVWVCPLVKLYGSLEASVAEVALFLHLATPELCLVNLHTYPWADCV